LVLHQLAAGALFEFVPGVAIPVAKLTDLQLEALWLHQWRVTRDQFPIARLGTQVHRAATVDDLETTFAVFGRIPESTWITHPASLGLRTEARKLLANFSAQLVNLHELAVLVSDQRIHSPVFSDEAGALLMVLRIAAEMIPNPAFVKVFFEVGYVPLSTHDFVQMCSAVYPNAERAVRATIPEITVPQNPEKLLDQLQSIRSSVWPTWTGPVARRCGDTIFLDLACASMRLNKSLEFPKVDGEQANARAAHFEDSVQAMIDTSPWFSPTTQQYHRRSLRNKGRVITDVDAIGAKSNSLLLVSCKSALYAEYDTADYRVVRNTSQLVEKAVLAWTEICSYLRANPIGDNYDFSGHHEMLGVVCTPVVVYLPVGMATAVIADGLFASVSVNELRDWLHGQRLEPPKMPAVERSGLYFLT
jgi:hypothetical protein